MIRLIGYILQAVAGLFGALVWFGIWIEWVGTFFGFWLACIFSPGIIVFPFFYWLIEGDLPQLYLIIWVVGVIGIGITMIGSVESEI